MLCFLLIVSNHSLRNPQLFGEIPLGISCLHSQFCQSGPKVFFTVYLDSTFGHNKPPLLFIGAAAERRADENLFSEVRPLNRILSGYSLDSTYHNR